MQFKINTDQKKKDRIRRLFTQWQTPWCSYALIQTAAQLNLKSKNLGSTQVSACSLCVEGLIPDGNTLPTLIVEEGKSLIFGKHLVDFN